MGQQCWSLQSSPPTRHKKNAPPYNVISYCCTTVLL
ncbi:hypothetical protein Goklo_007767, partial [Gossypium klotzschianum]|nr:hypothetical protein [Gossypium klotzschianum]